MGWTESINLKFCLLNAENLFLLFDQEPGPDFLQYSESQWQRLSTSVFENKPLKKCKELAQAFKEINADIIMLCEVGGYESLKNFNRLFLNDEFSPCLIEGNSDRNIDVGFLIRKNLSFYFDLQSNKNRPINYLYPHERTSVETNYPVKASSHKFSRDVAELKLFTKDQDDPFMIVLLTHLKSRLDPERIDPNGFERRQAELKTLIEIYKEMETKFSDRPIVIAGDFNGNASAENTDEEFKDIYAQTQWKDVLSHLSQEERATFYQIRNNGNRSEGRQIDFCFLTPLAQQFIDPTQSQVYRYKDAFGFAGKAPTSMDEKLTLPSDHYPIVFQLLNLPLR